MVYLPWNNMFSLVVPKVVAELFLWFPITLGLPENATRIATRKLLTTVDQKLNKLKLILDLIKKIKLSVFLFV